MIKPEQNGHTADYQALIGLGIKEKVAAKLDEIYQTGKLTHANLDDRALDALKEFSPDEALNVLTEFTESSLDHVTNKSAFLCGVMKTYRQRSRNPSATKPAKGPDPEKLQAILDRTGYPLEVTTGQRKYGGPPPDYDESTPGAGHELFCGKLPKDVYEDELIPVFEEIGKLWDLRLMVDPILNCSRGYAFVTYCDKADAATACEKLDGYEIRKDKSIKVNVSVANLRLFVGNIPKTRGREEIFEEFAKKAEGLADVIVYTSADEPKKKNRGFAFLEYDSHKNASTAKRKLSNFKTKAWGSDIIVDWADPIEEPDTATMDRVKVLYVKNVTSDITEEMLQEKFSPYGKLDKVKKIKDYAFVHFEEREAAVAAQAACDQMEIGDSTLHVSLAKPSADGRRKEQRKREQERRQMGQMSHIRGPYGYGYDGYWGPPGRMGPPRGRGGGGGGRVPPFRGYGGYDGYDDYYGYANDYYGHGDFDYYGGYMHQMPPHRGSRYRHGK